MGELRLMLDTRDAPDDATRYCYSTDEETYYGDFATRAGALAEAHGELEEVLAEAEGPLSVWTAVRKPVDVAALVQDWGDTVIEALGEASGEEFGEYAAEWPSVKGAAVAALDQAIRAAVVAWVAEHCPPAFFAIDSATIEQHEVR